MDVIDKQELTAIINYCYAQKKTKLVAHAPLMDLDLAEVNLANDVTMSCVLDRRAYNDVYDAYKHWYNQVNDRYSVRELPDWHVYKASFLQAGVISYTNLAEIKKELLETLNRDVMKGHPSAYIAFDTNILRDRFFSTVLLDEDELPHQQFSFALTEVIRDELTFSYKFSDRDMDALRAHPRLAEKGDVLDHFWNQNKLRDRQQRMGFVEYGKIQSRMNFLLCGNGEGGNANPDMKIIQNYQSFASVHRQILLLSRDNDFIALAQGRSGMNPVRAEYPAEITIANPYSWERLCELVYVWSVLYGCVELRVDGGYLRCFGMWRGKDPEDWSNEKMGVMWKGLVLDEPFKDIEICRTLGVIPQAGALRR